MKVTINLWQNTAFYFERFL